jgi:hypothetical protein
VRRAPARPQTGIPDLERYQTTPSMHRIGIEVVKSEAN